MEQGSEDPRDVSALVVARLGSVRAGSDPTLPWVVVDGSGVPVGPVMQWTHGSAELSMSDLAEEIARTWLSSPSRCFTWRVLRFAAISGTASTRGIAFTKGPAVG